MARFFQAEEEKLLLSPKGQMLTSPILTPRPRRVPLPLVLGTQTQSRDRRASNI